MTYAAFAAKDFEYLSLADAQLLAEKRKKSLNVVFLVDESDESRGSHELQIQDLKKFLEAPLGLNDQNLQESPTPYASENAWFLIMCQAPVKFVDRARFDPRALNHYVPAQHKDRIGDKGFKEKVADLKAQIQNDDSDTEKQQQLDAVEKLEGLGLVPTKVKGDGNCLLWSLLTLEGKREASHPDAMAMRAEPRTTLIWTCFRVADIRRAYHEVAHFHTREYHSDTIISIYKHHCN